MSRQTKLGALTESTANTVVGFVVSVLMWRFVVPVLWPELAPYSGWGYSAGVTVLFTLTSIARNYAVRRIFSRGYDA